MPTYTEGDMMRKNQAGLMALAIAGTGAVAGVLAARKALSTREVTPREALRFAKCRLRDVRDTVQACVEPLAQLRTLLRLAGRAGWCVRGISRIGFEDGMPSLYVSVHSLLVVIRLSGDEESFYIDEVYDDEGVRVSLVLPGKNPTFPDLVMAEHARRREQDAVKAQ